MRYEEDRVEVLLEVHHTPDANAKQGSCHHEHQHLHTGHRPFRHVIKTTLNYTSIPMSMQNEPAVTNNR